MCSLRVILIFLSATVAGFFLIRPGAQRRPIRRRRRRWQGHSQAPSASPFQGWISSENRILDYGGHGKWAVPLAHPCCTTSKI
ncbi:hypothetical protein BDA96_05G011300 [Sorghum bicolor]|uniref:Uncharacterized protein n=1 Tax=Sorghum bicolor TaxID=4558 RepID=A0A921QUG9_SORBI|nr:hypothetical protein BDA96_05G011300 [Sorghum bicolor]